jgi:hypothetical protein
MTTTTASTATTAATSGPTRARIRVVAGALVASALTIAGLLVTTPWGDRYDSSADDVLSYDTLAAVRDGAWAGTLADGIAFAVLGVALGLVTCHLARGRGRVPAVVGAVLTTVGGIVFAMGGFAFATLTWFASGIAEEDGRALVDYANDETGHLLGATLVGFALFTLGGLLLATALFRARAVPVAGVATYVVLVVAQFTPLSGRAIDYLQIVMMALFVVLGVKVLRER